MVFTRYSQRYMDCRRILARIHCLSPHAVNILDPALVKNETVNAGFSCQYTIDGQNPIQFAMAIGPNTWKPNTYNNILIQTPTLSAEKHNLTVSYLQYGHTTTLDYLIVQQGLPIPTAAASSITASPSTITHDNGRISVQNHHLNVRAVAGGTVGGVLLFIAILVYLSLYRCRKSQNADLDSIFDAEPLPTHVQLEPFKDSLEKPSATTPSGASENANPVDPTPTPRTKTAQISRLQSTTSPFSSSMHLPVPLPQLPIPDTNIDPFLNYGSSKPGPTTNSVQLSTCEAQASSSSIHSYNRLHLHPLLAADEPNADSLHDSGSSQLDNDDPPPHRINYPDTDSDGSLELEEHDDLLGAPDPGLRTSEPLSDLRVTRGVRHQHISRIVRHADSGMRLTRTRRSEDLLELPPEYTME
ncbi:hypothetical protein BDN70DRAFT_715460 [Pholiota conissans]|uniref:Uncharacterized protein n=1 Tax=Pholiota conissans TaxID=109636 RepID=A0A9P6D047_9AGAR|nr:hypothetical protein BDN70DRAFT_715460 [Pholiota conissans]